MPGAHVLRWWLSPRAGTVLLELIVADGQQRTFQLDTATAEQLHIATGQDISDETYATIEQTDRALQLIARLERFLAYRLRSSAEVAKRLRTLGAGDDDIRTVLELLHRYGRLDDERFARAFVRDAARLRMLSARAISSQLRARGIPDQIVQAAVATEYPSSDEEQRAREAALRALRRNASRPPEQQQRRVRDALLRRGFSHDVVRRVLASLFDSSSSNQ
ncbi:MAG: hypothetical protein AA908_01190 [Chlorobi bacterium NICIL-2]|nr:MAG: hypothetical protein AA908_01190 [Chlorobi bacterium NICIL-2]